VGVFLYQYLVGMFMPEEPGEPQEEGRVPRDGHEAGAVADTDVEGRTVASPRRGADSDPEYQPRH
jgi:hypothetical protein